MSDPLVVQSTDPDGTTETPLVVTSVDAPDPNPPAPEPAPEQHSVRADTEYVIIEASVPDEEGVKPTWTVAASALHAKGPQAACQEYAATRPQSLMPEKGLVLIAIPARSWKPVRIKPQTVTTLVMEDA